MNAFQIARVAQGVGFRGGALATIVAICLAESGGDPTAVSPTGDYGLAQINLAYHPDVTQQCAFDPQCNLEAAYRISGGGADFTPWATYTQGTYWHYHDQAVTAVAQLGAGGAAPGAAGDSSTNTGAPAWLPAAVVAGVIAWAVWG